MTGITPEDRQGALRVFMRDLEEPMKEWLWEAFGLLTQELAASWEDERGVNIPPGWAVEMMAEDLAERMLLDLGPRRLASPLFWDLYLSARKRRLTVVRALKAATESLPA